MNAEYYFYFPSVGTYKHFGPTVSINSVIVTKANEGKLKVVKEKTILNALNFRDVLITGDKQQILKFVKERNILDPITGYDHSMIYWLLKEKEFFIDFINILRSKAIFEEHVWKYAFIHCEEKGIFEYFEKNPNYKTLVGNYLQTTLMNIVPSDHGYRHLDYYPLINARAHRIGEGERVMNKNLRAVYHKLIEYLFEKKTLSVVDKLNLCYYLLLQDRVTECIKIFGSIDKAELGNCIQL